MDWTPNVWATRGFSSTLTLASATRPSVSATAFSRIGPSVLHGPHQGAHKSTTTGTVVLRASTSSWNVWSVTSTALDATARPGHVRPAAGRIRPVLGHAMAPISVGSRVPRTAGRPATGHRRGQGHRLDGGPIAGAQTATHLHPDRGRPVQPHV